MKKNNPSQILPKKKRPRGRQPGEIALNMDAIALLSEIQETLQGVLGNDVACEEAGYEPEIEGLRTLRKAVSTGQVSRKQIGTRLSGLIDRFSLTLEHDRADDQLTRRAISRAITGIEYLRNRNAELDPEPKQKY